MLFESILIGSCIIITWLLLGLIIAQLDELIKYFNNKDKEVK